MGRVPPAWRAAVVLVVGLFGCLLLRHWLILRGMPELNASAKRAMTYLAPQPAIFLLLVALGQLGVETERRTTAAQVVVAAGLVASGWIVLIGWI